MLIRQYTFFQTQIIVSLKHRPSVDAQSSLNCVLTSCLHTSSFAAYKSTKAAPLSPRFRFAHSDSVMDWFTWLSKTGLDPSLVYEYGLAFSNNELERDDISYFNHEFLQSMGISIAKHRLEILKLAKKDKRPTGFSRPRPISRLLGAIKRTKRYIKKCVNSLVHHQEYSSAIVVVPPRPSGYKWRGAMLKRNRKLTVAKSHSKQTRLLLTNGSASVDHSPVVYAVTKEGKLDAEDDDDGYWSNGVEEIRWDTMFQDLKPT